MATVSKDLLNFLISSDADFGRNNINDIEPRFYLEMFKAVGDDNDLFNIFNKDRMSGNLRSFMYMYEQKKKWVEDNKEAIQEMKKLLVEKY